MLEKEIEKAICAYAKSQGMMTRKLRSMSHKADPDQMIVYRGMLCVIEMKAPKKKPTKAQEAKLLQFGNQGCLAGWTDNIDEGKEIIDLFKNTVDVQLGMAAEGQMRKQYDQKNKKRIVTL